MFHHRVGITVKGYSCVLMSQNLRKRFDVHSAFERTGCERMAQKVKSFPFDPQFLLQQLKIPLL